MLTGRERGKIADYEKHRVIYVIVFLFFAPLETGGTFFEPHLLSLIFSASSLRRPLDVCDQIEIFLIFFDTAVPLAGIFFTVDKFN